MYRRILVLDDEELALNLFKTTLGDVFEVITARSFDEAMEIVKNSKEDFSVGFMDINIHGEKDGIETAEAILDYMPTIKFVFISGADLDFERVRKHIGDEFLFMKKPFEVETVKQLTSTLGLSWQRQMEAEEAKHELLRQKELILNSTEDGIIEISIANKGKIQHANQSCYDIFGYSKEEFSNLFFSDISLYCKENATSCSTLLDSGVRKVDEDIFVHKDGSEIPVSYTIIPVVEENGGKSIIIVFRDRSYAKEYEKNLEETARYWENIFDSLEDIIITLDENINVVKMNRAAKALLPYEFSQDIKYCSLKRDYSTVSLENIILDTLETGKNHNMDSSIESIFPILDGKYFIVSTYPVKNPKGNKEVVLTLRDITQRKNMEDKLRELSIKDTLTGLFNRRHFANCLFTEHKRALRSNSGYACIMIDIDHFKKVNDNYGHEFGDFVIKEFAILMQKEVRSTDVIARWGGEEFMILLPDTDLNGAMVPAKKILESTRNYLFNNGKVSKDDVTVSIGVSASKASELDNCNLILSIVDDKLYEAKEGGRNRICG